MTRLTITDLERRLAVARSTVGKWCRRGKFPAPHYLEGKRRWLLSDVEEWERGRVTG